MRLAPLAVLPEFQRQRIGTLLVDNGLERLMNGDCSYDIVLGEQAYFSRFGFRSDSGYEVKCTWEVPKGSFQLLVLKLADQPRLRGPARYHPEFDGLE